VEGRKAGKRRGEGAAEAAAVAPGAVAPGAVAQCAVSLHLCARRNEDLSPI